MFGVTVSGHVMVAHSLVGAVFGPAQALHGATFVVEAGFFGESLDADGVLVDIGACTEALRSVLADLDYRNLDEHPGFAGLNTTTEVVARHIADRLAAQVRGGALGLPGHVGRVAVTLHESPTARASYERTP